MRDFPAFETDFGTAGLVLNQIPYTKTAYIHMINILDKEMLLLEAVDFCVAAGAEIIYLCDDEVKTDEQNVVHIYEMKQIVAALRDTDACLIPLTDDMLERWLEIYHKKMNGVDHSAHISYFEGKKMVLKGGCYFVHKDGTLLGIGQAYDNTVSCIAAVIPGAGADVLSALCHGLSSETVRVEVASTNLKAIRFYEKIGFVKTGIIRTWYRVR